jgi:hypothetical protein
MILLALLDSLTQWIDALFVVLLLHIYMSGDSQYSSVQTSRISVCNHGNGDIDESVCVIDINFP